MSAPPLRSERRGPVTVVTIDRPEVRNCIDARTADRLTAAIEGFAGDEDAAGLALETELGRSSIDHAELAEGTRRFVEGGGVAERGGDGGAAGGLHP